MCTQISLQQVQYSIYSFSSLTFSHEILYSMCHKFANQQNCRIHWALFLGEEKKSKGKRKVRGERIWKWLREGAMGLTWGNDERGERKEIKKEKKEKKKKEKNNSNNKIK